MLFPNGYNFVIEAFNINMKRILYAAPYRVTLPWQSEIYVRIYEKIFDKCFP